MANIQKRKGRSDFGTHKWQTDASLARYRAKRIKANKLAKSKRRQNRGL